MKRLTAITIIFVMIMLVIPTNAAPETIVDIECETAISVVKALGFMDGYPDGTFRSENRITRAEFASIISKLLNLSVDESKGEITYFSDVTESHWASPYVNIVSSRGFMSGGGDGQFLPENNITVNEVAKVMVCLMGYRYFAEVSGGYPNGYYMQANAIGLLDGLHTDAASPITRGEMAQLLCSAFDVDIYQTDSYGDDVEMKKEDGITLLSKYHDIYTTEGIVTANRFTAVNDESKIRDNEIEIDDERYYTNNDVSSYLGYNVKAYYRYDDSKNTRTILFIEKIKNNVKEISADSVNDINGYRINYFEENGKKKSIDINSNTNIIWNNEFDSRAVNFDFDTLASVNGSLTFIDNDCNNKYDVVIVENYTVGVVDSISADNERINLKWTTGSLKLEDFNYTIYKGGEVITLSELLSSDVLCIIGSKGFASGVSGSVVEIYVSDKSVNGTVVAIGDNNVTIETKDGKRVYDVSPQYVCERGNDIRIDDRGSFYLDMNGKIISCPSIDSGIMKFGYIMDAVINEGIVIEVKLKMLTVAGNVEVVKVKDNVRLDGNKVTAKEAYEKLREIADGEQISMIVRYGLDADGNINALDTKEHNSDDDPDALTITPLAQKMRYQSRGLMLVSGDTPKRYIIDSNVKVFLIPEAGSADDEYRIYGNSYFANEVYYENLIMCNVKDGTPAAIVINNATAAASSLLGKIQLSEGPSAVIKSKVQALDLDGNVCTKLILDSKGKDVEAYVTNSTTLLFSNGSNNVKKELPGSDEELTIDDFNFGDVVMYDVDSKGRANVLLRINDYSLYDLEHGKYQVTGMSGYNEFIMGSVRKKNGTVLEIDVSTTPNLYINAQWGPYVSLVDKRTKTVTTASLDEIFASDSNLEADKIFARVRFGNVAEIFIYR